MPPKLAPLTVVTTGRPLTGRKWWIVESIENDWVKLTRLEWSKDLIKEVGVMRRTPETIRRKIKGGYLICSKFGLFDIARTQPIIAP